MAAKAKLTLRETEEREEVVELPTTQRKKPEVGRFLLQVDRQTKSSHKTAEAATAAGSAIKKGHPKVQVAVYDTVESVSTVVDAS
jgi:hypothetical protein